MMINFTDFFLNYNASYAYQTQQTEYEERKFIVINLTVAVLTVLLSQITIWFYQANRKTLLLLPSSKLQLSLLISQTFVGFAATLNPATFVLSSSFRFSDSQKLVYRVIIDLMKKMGVEVMIMHLCGQTLDRFISLFFSYKYKAYVSHRNVAGFVAIAWIVPIIVNLIQLIWLYEFISGSFFAVHSVALYEIWYLIICMLIFIILPSVLNGIALLSMFIKIRFILMQTSTMNMSYNRYQEFRTSVLFIFIYILFIILGMPFFSLRLAMDIEFLHKQTLHVNTDVYKVTEICQHFSLLMYPLIYVGICPKFRKQLLRTLNHFKATRLLDNSVLLTLRSPPEVNMYHVDTPL